MPVPIYLQMNLRRIVSPQRTQATDTAPLSLITGSYFSKIHLTRGEERRTPDSPFHENGTGFRRNWKTTVNRSHHLFMSINKENAITITKHNGQEKAAQPKKQVLRTDHSDKKLITSPPASPPLYSPSYHWYNQPIQRQLTL